MSDADWILELQFEHRVRDERDAAKDGMARLLHEIWIDAEGLHGCSFAGPMGDDARAMFGPDARLVHEFWAGCHIEAMTIYHRYLNREPYSTEFPVADADPYPDAWLAIQLGAGHS